MSGESRKEKKKRILARNKRHNLINLMAWQHEGAAERGESAAPEFDPGRGRDDEREKKKKDEEMVWSKQAGMIRNRITGKKRASKDRWNRFAGTSGGGGRGL